MQIDTFESQFKSAYKEPYKFESLDFSKISLISRLGETHAKAIQQIASRLLPKYSEQYEWSFIVEKSFTSVREALGQVEQARPELIITERNVKITEESLIYGLSPYIETVTQITDTPVLLLPNQSVRELEDWIKDCNEVMAETNRLTGDSTIINWGVAFAKANGSLYINHIEDNKTFERYMDVLEKIPEIDSALAEEKIKNELLKLPEDFIESVKASLSINCPKLELHGIVKLGHSIKDYRQLLDAHEIDLLIVNSKDKDHLAMEGIAYEIAVEFKDKPLLLL